MEIRMSTALRFSQDWLDKNAEHALAARSTLSFGLPIFDATVLGGQELQPHSIRAGDQPGKFFTWFPARRRCAPPVRRLESGRAFCSATQGKTSSRSTVRRWVA
jgi:hypothetical protein